MERDSIEITGGPFGEHVQVSDLMVEPIEIPQPGPTGNYYVHMGLSRSAVVQLQQLEEKAAWLAKLEKAARGLSIERIEALAWAESMIGKTVYRIGSDSEGDPRVTAYQIKGYHTTGKKKKFRFDAAINGTKQVVSMNLKHCYQDRESAEAEVRRRKEEQL